MTKRTIEAPALDALNASTTIVHEGELMTVERLTFSAYQEYLERINYTPHWDLVRWSNAMAGEAGEACNLVKKIDRGLPSDPNLDEAREALGEELADVIAYATYLANAAGIPLEEAIRRKNAKVCAKIGISEQLP
jgi:NTP pyrophosphatase (non-canonical NTP hydrolase)